MVTARNVGRSPVELTRWGFDLGRDITNFTRAPVPTSAPIPSTLAGGHEANFLMELAELEASVARADTGKQPRAFVRLATGKRIYSNVVKLGR
jgi:hypothetical protein